MTIPRARLEVEITFVIVTSPELQVSPLHTVDLNDSLRGEIPSSLTSSNESFDTPFIPNSTFTTAPPLQSLDPQLASACCVKLAVQGLEMTLRDRYTVVVSAQLAIHAVQLVQGDKSASEQLISGRVRAIL